MEVVTDLGVLCYTSLEVQLEEGGIYPIFLDPITTTRPLFRNGFYTYKISQNLNNNPNFPNDPTISKYLFVVFDVCFNPITGYFSESVTNDDILNSLIHEPGFIIDFHVNRRLVNKYILPIYGFEKLHDLSVLQYYKNKNLYYIIFNWIIQFFNNYTEEIAEIIVNVIRYYIILESKPHNTYRRRVESKDRICKNVIDATKNFRLIPEEYVKEYVNLEDCFKIILDSPGKIVLNRIPKCYQEDSLKFGSNWYPVYFNLLKNPADITNAMCIRLYYTQPHLNYSGPPSWLNHLKTNTLEYIYIGLKLRKLFLKDIPESLKNDIHIICFHDLIYNEQRNIIRNPYRDVVMKLFNTISLDNFDSDEIQYLLNMLYT
jgi:hypothetical protein